MAVAEGEFKYSATHVEAFPDMSRDAGSIPAASTQRQFAKNRRLPLFVRLWDLRREAACVRSHGFGSLRRIRQEPRVDTGPGAF